MRPEERQKNFLKMNNKKSARKRTTFSLSGRESTVLESAAHKMSSPIIKFIYNNLKSMWITPHRYHK